MNKQSLTGYTSKKIILISLFLFVIFTAGIFFVKASNTPSASKSAEPTAILLSAPMSVLLADKIEIVNFFGTQRCVSCLTVGRFTKKTLEDKFSSELESGKILFREINGELPENRDMVIKYQARGSSLFVNAIRGDKDDITEDVTVWRLVNDEDQFISYLENKLNTLLGK